MTTRKRRHRPAPQPSPSLRVRAIRHQDEGSPVDVDKLVALVLDIAETRHAAWRQGRPDPYGLPHPPGLAELVSGPGQNDTTPHL
jgi:hypothetical protein